MIQLTSDSLGKRQQELNKKVLEAVEKQISFDEIRDLEEKSDVDKLYKIDVASHYKNIDYIVDIFKCGDSLYISRALKGKWLYDDEFGHIINPDYLHHKIFPLMSFKMKTKMLNSIAINVRNEARVASFFEYCHELKMNSFASKFLLNTSETFKLSILDKHFDLTESINVKHFVGNSYDIATIYIQKVHPYHKNSCLKKLSYLYLMDEEKYLDIFEGNTEQNSACQFGGRMSKSIMTKHKSRVLAKPKLYLKFLNNYAVARHSSSDDAKKFIIDILPVKIEEFWNNNYYQKYKYIFNIIPNNEVMTFFKSTFAAKYGSNQEFEMTLKFFNYKYYELYTAEEREQWALRHVEEGREILGSNTDYTWYRFVNFDKAFDPIKQYIFLTKDEDTRNSMLRILISSAGNQTDLENLFNYFYERHINENGHHKEDFIDKVVSTHNIFKFEEPCWNALNKILHSMEVYTPGFYGKDKCRVFCLMYNIIHGKDMHDALTYLLETCHRFGDFKSYSNKLDDGQWNQVFEYLCNYYIGRFQRVNMNDMDAAKQEKTVIVNTIKDLFDTFEKPRDDFPAIVVSFIEENEDLFKHLKIKDEKKLVEADLLRLLKKDKALVLEKLPELKDAMDCYSFRLTRFIKKIRIYFSNDLRVDCAKFFKDCTDNITKNPRYILKTCVYGIFQLEDENSKVQFLNQYVPTDEKIDHKNIDRRVLTIQEVICRSAGYSRPPLPLSTVLQFIKGDYVHFCLPTFNMYLSNLPLPESNEFIKAILDTPLSIQKHGVRLAFKVYSIDNLKNLICNIWQKTKNVSLRLVIYKALVNKINESIYSSQIELVEPLKKFTASLNGDDDDDIFELLCSSDNIPTIFRDDLLKCAWGAIKTLSHKKLRNITLKTKLVNAILKSSTVDRDFMRTEIINEHIQIMLCNKEIVIDYKSEENELNTSMWIVTATYIICCNNESEYEDSLQVLELIILKTFENWNNYNFVFTKFLYSFIRKMRDGCVTIEYSFPFIVPIFEKILKKIEAHSPTHEMFLFTLDIKLFIEMRKALNKESCGFVEIARDASELLLPYIHELRAKELILPCLFNDISILILKNLRVLGVAKKMDSNILIANICNYLVMSNNIDAILFAISIMPLKCLGYNEMLYLSLRKAFTKKVKQINDFQVQSYFYKKFILSGTIEVY